ncbi:rCG48878 [Rattus norvegicus]|uniref:RCG48878 n=1 Tax=Rattus norvegicus TaxID=10116 RepID=A6IGG4_RAT|nr:rCG48878 [Rattus norvegicus]
MEGVQIELYSGCAASYALSFWRRQLRCSIKCERSR